MRGSSTCRMKMCQILNRLNRASLRNTESLTESFQTNTSTRASCIRRLSCPTEEAFYCSTTARFTRACSRMDSLMEIAEQLTPTSQEKTILSDFCHVRRLFTRSGQSELIQCSEASTFEAMISGLELSVIHTEKYYWGASLRISRKMAPSCSALSQEKSITSISTMTRCQVRSAKKNSGPI